MRLLEPTASTRTRAVGDWAYKAKAVGVHWDGHRQVFGGNDGMVYAVANSGELYAYRFTGQDTGEFNWEFTRISLGEGWNLFSHVFGGEDGIVYAVLR